MHVGHVRRQRFNRYQCVGGVDFGTRDVDLLNHHLVNVQAVCTQIRNRRGHFVQRDLRIRNIDRPSGRHHGLNEKTGTQTGKLAKFDIDMGRLGMNVGNSVNAQLIQDDGRNVHIRSRHHEDVGVVQMDIAARVHGRLGEGDMRHRERQIRQRRALTQDRDMRIGVVNGRVRGDVGLADVDLIDCYAAPGLDDDTGVFQTQVTASAHYGLSHVDIDDRDVGVSRHINRCVSRVDCVEANHGSLTDEDRTHRLHVEPTVRVERAHHIDGVRVQRHPRMVCIELVSEHRELLDLGTRDAQVATGRNRHLGVTHVDDRAELEACIDAGPKQAHTAGSRDVDMRIVRVDKVADNRLHYSRGTPGNRYVAFRFEADSNGSGFDHSGCSIDIVHLCNHIAVIAGYLIPTNVDRADRFQGDRCVERHTVDGTALCGCPDIAVGDAKVALRLDREIGVLGVHVARAFASANDQIALEVKCHVRVAGDLDPIEMVDARAKGQVQTARLFAATRQLETAIDDPQLFGRGIERGIACQIDHFGSDIVVAIGQRDVRQRPVTAVQHQVTVTHLVGCSRDDHAQVVSRSDQRLAGNDRGVRIGGEHIDGRNRHVGVDLEVADCAGGIACEVGCTDRDFVTAIGQGCEDGRQNRDRPDTRDAHRGGVVLTTDEHRDHATGFEASAGTGHRDGLLAFGAVDDVIDGNRIDGERGTAINRHHARGGGGVARQIARGSGDGVSAVEQCAHVCRADENLPGAARHRCGVRARIEDHRDGLAVFDAMHRAGHWQHQQLLVRVDDVVD